MRIVVKIKADADAKDPDAEKRRIVDAFAEIGVSPSDLRAYLGHDVEKTQAKELQGLRDAYQALKEGETTFAELMAERTGSTEEQETVLEEKLAAAKVPDKQPEPEKPAAEPEQTTKPASDQPPADLPDLEVWPDAPQDDWYKIAGVIFRFSEEHGNYRRWDPSVETPAPRATTRTISRRKQ